MSLTMAASYIYPTVATGRAFELDLKSDLETFFQAWVTGRMVSDHNFRPVRLDSVVRG